MSNNASILSNPKPGGASRGGFLAVPTPDLEPHVKNEVTSRVAWIQRVLRKYHATHNPSWDPPLTTGSDVPYAGPVEIQKWIRNWMVHCADFCIVLLTDPSTGCGAVGTWANELGVPLLVLAAKDVYVSPLIGATPLSSFVDNAGLAVQLERWLSLNAAVISEGDERRNAALRRSEPERLRHVAAWRSMGDGGRAEAAGKLRMDRGELRDLLIDPLGFAWAPRPIRSAMEQVFLHGGMPPSNMRLPWQLGATELEFFHLAVDEYGWNPHDAAITLEAGICFEVERLSAQAEGVLLRKSPLTKREGWKDLHDRVCGTDES